MFTNVGIAHFGIPVSDLQRSVDFYCNVVGCRFVRGEGKYAFLDSNGVCIALCLQNKPVNGPSPLNNLHHAFMVSVEDFPNIEKHLADQGVEIVGSEDRRGGTIDGPRFYVRDPDGTRVELIYMTNYDRSTLADVKS
jgi:glyoxylase I family protein